MGYLKSQGLGSSPINLESESILDAMLYDWSGGGGGVLHVAFCDVVILAFPLWCSCEIDKKDKIIVAFFS